MDRRAVLALIFTIAIWGVGPVFIRTLSLALGPADHLVIRYTLVSLAYLAGLAAMGGWRIAREDWPRLLVLAIVGLSPLGSAFGLELVPAGIGSLIIGTEPIIIACLGTLVAREKLSIGTIAGLVVGFAGTAMLVWNDAGAGGGRAEFLRGCVYVFLGVVAFSAYVVVSKPLIRKYGTYSISALSVLLSTVLMLLLLARPSVLTTVATMTTRNWFDMAYIVVLATFIGAITWNYGASRLPAATSGSLLYLFPVIGVLAGVLLLGESVTWSMLAGGALILLGIAIAQFGSSMKRVETKPPEK